MLSDYSFIYVGVQSKRREQIHLMALGFGMTVLLMPTLATAQSATATVNVSSGTVIAKGAGVDVSVEVRCTDLPANGPGNTSLQLTERVGNKIASGFGSSSDTITCDGSFQTVHVVVPAQGVFPNPPSKFAKGVAVAQANFFVCALSGSPCATNQQTKQIELTNK